MLLHYKYYDDDDDYYYYHENLITRPKKWGQSNLEKLTWIPDQLLYCIGFIFWAAPSSNMRDLFTNIQCLWIHYTGSLNTVTYAPHLNVLTFSRDGAYSFLFEFNLKSFIGHSGLFVCFFPPHICLVGVGEGYMHITSTVRMIFHKRTNNHISQGECLDFAKKCLLIFYFLFPSMILIILPSVKWSQDLKDCMFISMQASRMHGGREHESWLFLAPRDVLDL